MKRCLIRGIASLLPLLFLTLAAGPVLAAGTPAGTVISNQATVDYTDVNGNPLQTVSNIVTTVVSQVSIVTVDPDRASSATPGDTVHYAHDVTNGGNGDDTVDLTAVSSNGWATALFLDADASGTFTPGDTPLADSDGDGTVDTGLLAADAVARIIVSVTVPAAIANGTVDTVTVTGTSSQPLPASDTAIDTTTINAPDMSVVKSVAPAGPQPPATVLTYTVVVTNNGASDAAGVVLTDAVPANTTYVPGSMTLDGVGKTDGGPDDEGDFNVTAPNAVTMTIGTLAPGATATVTFQVTID
ncbi:MAG TPA: hypothetical protein VJV23_05920 [Candidatus Polarisedimenticolia bacterium]|nr:hypothetical protein [Candidatus Polarisedimenticolia bacterium]